MDIQILSDRYDQIYDPNSSNTIYDYGYNLVKAAVDAQYDDTSTDNYDYYQAQYDNVNLFAYPHIADFNTYINANQAALATAQADWTTADSQITSQTSAFESITNKTYKPDVKDFYQYVNPVSIS